MNLDCVADFDAPTRTTYTQKANAVYMVISTHFGVSRLDQISERRDAKTALARHWGMYLMRKCYGWSLPKIGQVYSDRDHTTAWNGVTKIEKIVSETECGAQLYLKLHADVLKCVSSARA